MAPQQRRTRPRPQQAAPVDMTKVQIETKWIDIHSVKPYEFNARKNAKAVKFVEASIKAFGFLVPIVVGKDGDLAAGHTRIEAAKNLGMDYILAADASHLTQDQLDAFRLADNKVAEMADWDNDLLGTEMSRLHGLFDFTEFGWTQAEVDCLSEVVPDDCLNVADIAPAQTERAEGQATARRGPTTTRFVLGELVFFEDTQQTKRWLDGIRHLHNFNEADIIADIKNRLGILQG